MFIEASVLILLVCVSCLNYMKPLAKDLLLSYFMLGSGIVNKITTTTVEHCGVSVSKQYILCGNELLGN